MIIPSRPAAAIFLLAALASFAAPAVKTYDFPEVRIEIAVARDGSFLVDEFRTFAFRGDFTWAQLWIPTRVERQGFTYDADVEGLTIADESGAPLRAEISRAASRVEAKWYFRARNTRRTFHIRYRVTGAVLCHPDVCELYWQAIGEGWSRPTASATVLVRLPAPVPAKDRLLVYGHGPLTGMSEIVDLQTARFTATRIPAGQFLEVRVLWPPGLTQGVESDRRTLASIRDEEEKRVIRTIEDARRYVEAERAKSRLIKTILVLWLIGLVAIPLAWLPFYLAAWRRVGRDYRFSDLPPYLHEPPSGLSPALVETLLREGEAVTPRSFTATIFDLATRGFLQIEDFRTEKRGLFGSKEVEDTRLTLRAPGSKSAALLPFEESVLDVLFVEAAGGSREPGAAITLEELKKYLGKHPQEFQKWFREWGQAVKAEAKSRGFIEPESLRARNVFLAVSIPLAVLTANFVLAVLIGVLVPKLKRRSPEWARENELWKGLKRFLHDFSEFKELPPEAFKLWERYLVFGILFGTAKKIIRALPMVLGDERAASPVWYSGYGQTAFLQAGSIQSLIHGIDSLSSSLEQASTSAAHYSSGSGGGFSGGGGGGAGGGGGSAG